MAKSTVCNCTAIFLLVGANASTELRNADYATEWVSGDTNSTAQWETIAVGDLVYHKLWRQTQIEFDESDKPNGNGMAEWGNVYYLTDNDEYLTVQTGPDASVRDAFVANGKLSNTLDDNYRAINDNWPVFGFAHDLGTVGHEVQRRLFSIGLLQQNAVQFLGANGLVSLPSLWTSHFATECDAVSQS